MRVSMTARLLPPLPPPTGSRERSSLRVSGASWPLANPTCRQVGGGGGGDVGMAAGRQDCQLL
jgi:hypothetical protein